MTRSALLLVLVPWLALGAEAIGLSEDEFKMVRH